MLLIPFPIKYAPPKVTTFGGAYFIVFYDFTFWGNNYYSIFII